MPIPFFAHQAAVLPLKLARPRWFDGVALVISSIVPDLAYALLPEVRVVSHNAVGLFTWCVPMGVSLTLLVRYGLAAALARSGLEKLRAVCMKPLEPFKLLASTLVGAGSHILWDGIVHPDPTYRARWSLTTHMPAWPHTLSNVLGVPLGAYLLFRWWRSLRIEGAPPPAPHAKRLRARLLVATIVGFFVAAFEYQAQLNAERTFFDVNGTVMRAAAIVGTCVLLASLSSAFAADGDSERLS